MVQIRRSYSLALYALLPDSKVPQVVIVRAAGSDKPNKYDSVVGRTTYMVQKERMIKIENIILKIYIPTLF